MPKTLEMLAQKGQFHLSSELQAKLASRGFTDIISRSANGERELLNYQNIYSSLIHSLEFFSILLQTVSSSSEIMQNNLEPWHVLTNHSFITAVVPGIWNWQIVLTWFMNKLFVIIFLIHSCPPLQTFLCLGGGGGLLNYCWTFSFHPKHVLYVMALVLL